jgi:hypothetical protein
MYTCVSFIVDVRKHHRCVPKDNEFRCLANGQSIKVGVELSGAIASHKTLTLVVGMTMLLDDFLRQWMLQKAIILF